MYSFGSGNLFALVGALPVARKFGALQEISVDFSVNLKPLYGQKQFPLTVARGQGKIECKAKFGRLNGAMLNDLFFGGSNATGTKIQVNEEPGTVPGSSTYTVTVANSANFDEDLGVTNATTGIPFTRVAASPAAGQYTVAAGVYTFAAADANALVLIDYTYTSASLGNLTTINNQLTGVATPFAVSLAMSYESKPMYLKLLKCVSSKLTMATKLEDFTIPDFDFQAFANDAGVVGYFSARE